MDGYSKAKQKYDDMENKNLNPQLAYIMPIFIQGGTSHCTPSLSHKVNVPDRVFMQVCERNRNINIKYGVCD